MIGKGKGIGMRGILTGLLVLLCSSGAHATTIAYWNFDGYTDAGSATVLAPNAGSGTLTITGFPDADLSQENGTTINQTTPADAGTNDALGLSNNANNGDRIDINISLIGFEDPVLTYVERKQNNDSFDANQWSYSIDGGTTFSSFGAAVNPTTSFALVTRDFTGVSALANQGSVVLRYVVGSAAKSSARNDIDNIQINASAMVPEPSTCALLSLGLFGLAISRRRSRSRAARC